MDIEKLTKECDSCSDQKCKNGKMCSLTEKILIGLLKKLDETEQLTLIWLLAQAKGSGNWSADEFASALAKAMKDQ